MNDERDRRRTDRRNERTNTTRATASGSPGDDTEHEGGGAALRYRQGGSRTGSADSEEFTSAEPTDGDQDGTLLPSSVYREGRTVTASAPTRGGIEDYLHEVYRNTPPVDGVIVLTTERPAAEVLETHLAGTEEKRAPTGVIDTRSAGQYVEDVYRESPVHYTTADSDIERTAMSVVELVEALSTSPAGRVHLIVDSYATLCESLSPGDRARLLNAFHSQIDGYQIYTTDDADDALNEWTDGSIRVEGDAEKGIETRYERS